MIAQVMLRKRNTVRSMMKRKITKKRIMMMRRKKKTHQIQTKKQNYFIVATKYCPDFTKHIL